MQYKDSMSDDQITCWNSWLVYQTVFALHTPSFLYLHFPLWQYVFKVFHISLPPINSYFSLPYLQMFCLLSLSQDTTVPQWVFQVIVLQISPNKETRQIKCWHYHRVKSLLVVSAGYKCLPLFGIYWGFRGLYISHRATVQPVQPSNALYLTSKEHRLD